jgi:Na+-driven multidrug efflux pump
MVGAQLGRNAPVQARVYYRSFRYIAFWFIVVTTILFWALRVQIINLFTSHKNIQNQAFMALWLFPFNIFPDLFKGMQKGIIMALGIQNKAIYVHILCHLMIYPTAIWFFAFHNKMGIVGIWLAKITLEYCLLTCYVFIIETTDWVETAKIAAEK